MLSQADSNKLTKKNNNIIKYDPLQLVFGEIPFSWERRITNHMSFELTFGPTRSGIIKNRFWLRDSDTYGVTGKFGIVAGGNVRFYLRKEANPLSKVYVAPGFRYRTLLDKERDYTRESIGFLTIGYQHQFPRRLLLDVYAAFGYEFVKRREFFGLNYSNLDLSNYFVYTTYSQFIAAAGVKISVRPLPKELIGTKREKFQSPKVESRRLVFKFAPQRLALADYELGVEYRFSKKWSVELEGGITKSHTALERFYLKVPYPGYSYHSSFQGTTALGYAGSISFRYYLTERAGTLSGWYLSPGLKYRRYNDNYYFENYDYENNIDYSQSAKGGLNETIASVVVGNQIWLWKHVALDVYAGLGLGGFHGIYRVVGEKVPGWQGFYPYYGFYGVKYDKTSLVPIAGLKLSVGF